MDATPVTLGQEFGGYAAAVRASASSGSSRCSRGSANCRWAAPRSAPASTPRPAFAAVGSSPCWRKHGLNLPLTEARNHFEAQGARDRSGRDCQAGSCAYVAAEPLQDLPTTSAGCPPGRRAGLSGDPPARPAARQVLDHARQGQPGHPRGHSARSSRRSSATTPRSRSAVPTGNLELNVNCCRSSPATCSESIRLLSRPPPGCWPIKCIDGHRRRRSTAAAGLCRVVAVDRHAAEQVHRV